MTKCRSRVVWHETSIEVQGRTLCVAEQPGLCLLKPKGTRQVVSVAWSSVYNKACELSAGHTSVEPRDGVRVRRGAVNGTK